MTSVVLHVERAARRTLFKACRRAVQSLSYDQVRAIGLLSGELQFRMAQILKRRLLHEMACVLEGAPTQREIAAILRCGCRTNNAAALEILKILEARQDVASLMTRVEVSGIAAVQAALAAGNGAILLATHMGTSALLLIHLAQCGIPLTVVHREAPMMESGFFGRGIERYDIEPVLANRGSQAYRRILSALRANRAVYTCIDQGVKNPHEGLVLRFLGKDMPMPAGPAHLMRRTNAPVLPVAALAAKPKWRFEILPPLELEIGADLATDLQALLRSSERIIQRSPHLWSWHQRRWRHFPLAADLAVRK